jgi:hypothetical protein
MEQTQGLSSKAETLIEKKINIDYNYHHPLPVVLDREKEEFCLGCRR